MKIIVLSFVVMLTILSTVHAERVEISPGVSLYPTPENLQGKLVFLAGRFPVGGKLSPAKIMTYSFATKTISLLWDIPQAGDLLVSPDGRWVALVIKDPTRIAGATISVLSMLTRETRHIALSSLDADAAIVDDFVISRTETGWRKQKLEMYSLNNGARSQIHLDENEDIKGEYTFVSSKMYDPYRFYIGYAPSRLNDDAKMQRGIYAYDVRYNTFEKVHDGEPSATDEIILWEQSGRTAHLAANSFKERNPSRRVIRRFRDTDFSFVQLSPCRRYALIKWSSLISSGMWTRYFICDLRSGDLHLLVEAKPSTATQGVFISSLHWIHDQTGNERGVGSALHNDE